MLQAVLGVQVEWRNVDRIPEGRHVLVSNHVTTGDMMALYRRPRRIVHLISTGLPKRVAKVSLSDSSTSQTGPCTASQP